MLDEIEGTIQGHRDGHGFVARDDGEADIYLPPNEMRAVLHKDRVKVRVVRSDRKGRPEGRVVEIVERPKQPIIGRLLQEGGVWLVAPEDKRYGQDVMIPRSATGDGKPGQVVVKEFYAELPISIKLGGAYHDLGAFASDISNLARIVTLNNVNLQANEKSGQLTLEAVAKTFRYLDKEEIDQGRRDAIKANKAKNPSAAGGEVGKK